MQHLCQEANISATNTVHAMVKGQVFDRRFHGKKLLQEILLEFYCCCTDNNVDIHDDVAE